jgi:hypothetical protein
MRVKFRLPVTGFIAQPANRSIVLSATINPGVNEVLMALYQPNLHLFGEFATDYQI